MPPRKDLVGQVFSHLKVIKLDKEKTQEKKRTHWIVECDCGIQFSVLGSNLGRNTTKCKYCKAENIVGQKFNRLTVIARVIDDEDHVKWKCQCECGNIIIVRKDSLTTGHTKSCGCLQKEIASKNTKINLIGQKFGKLTVIAESLRRDNEGNFFWYCNCDCGTTNHEVNGHILKSGRIQSCGCVRSRGEEKIAGILSNNNIPFKREYIVKDLTLSTGGNPHFDFAIMDDNNNVKYFIEYNGEQHYISRGSIFTEEKVATIQQRDKKKIAYCKENNIPLIIIPYTKYNNLNLNDLLLKGK